MVELGSSVDCGSIVKRRQSPNCVSSNGNGGIANRAQQRVTPLGTRKRRECICDGNPELLLFGPDHPRNTHEVRGWSGTTSQRRNERERAAKQPPSTRGDGRTRTSRGLPTMLPTDGSNSGRTNDRSRTTTSLIQRAKPPDIRRDAHASRCAHCHQCQRKRTMSELQRLALREVSRLARSPDRRHTPPPVNRSSARSFELLS